MKLPLFASINNETKEIVFKNLRQRREFYKNKAIEYVNALKRYEESPYLKPQNDSN